MIERVVVEIQDETTEEGLSKALPAHMEIRHLDTNEYLVTVFEARDAEQEVIEALTDAGIDSYVRPYEED